jgi:dUTP pyrophosphatase
MQIQPCPTLSQDSLSDLDVLLQRYSTIMKLNICIDDKYDKKELLYSKYKTKIQLHNNNMMNNQYIDAGFDIFVPETCAFYSDDVSKVDFNIKCSASIVRITNNINKCVCETPTGFYMYPRSSISKTNIRLANSVGIIDSGYRGNLMGMFDVAYDKKIRTKKFIGCSEIINEYERIVQICSPCLVPILVNLVINEDELGIDTLRGNNGFGSSGK